MADPVKKKVSASKKFASRKSNNKPIVEKSSGEPADDVLNLVRDFAPGAQGMLHRFSLHLQATIARKGMMWSNISVMFLVVIISILTVYQSTNVRIVGIDAFGRMYDVKTRSSGEYIYTNAQVAAFASEAILETFDLSFTNFTRRLEQAGNIYYTASGKVELQKAIQALATDIKSSQAVVHAESAGEATIIGYDSERKLWKVTKEINITFSPAEGKRVTNKRMITLIIKRIDDYDSLKGIGIIQINQGRT
jgi:predicted NAD-dependent protein-ADP-ribosyltransferase YbiA (DUF1768 family)